MFRILHPDLPVPLSLLTEFCFHQCNPDRCKCKSWLQYGNSSFKDQILQKQAYDYQDGVKHKILEYDNNGNLIREFTEEEIEKYLMLL